MDGTTYVCLFISDFVDFFVHITLHFSFNFNVVLSLSPSHFHSFSFWAFNRILFILFKASLCLCWQQRILRNDHSVLDVYGDNLLPKARVKALSDGL